MFTMTVNITPHIDWTHFLSSLPDNVQGVDRRSDFGDYLILTLMHQWVTEAIHRRAPLVVRSAKNLGRMVGRV